MRYSVLFLQQKKSCIYLNAAHDITYKYDKYSKCCKQFSCSLWPFFIKCAIAALRWVSSVDSAQFLHVRRRIFMHINCSKEWRWNQWQQQQRQPQRILNGNAARKWIAAKQFEQHGQARYPAHRDGRVGVARVTIGAHCAREPTNEPNEWTERFTMCYGLLLCFVFFIYLLF